MTKEVSDYLEHLRITRNIHMAVTDDATLEDVKETLHIIDEDLKQNKKVKDSE